MSERLAAVPPRGIPTVEFTVAGTRRLRRLGLAGRRLGAVAGPHALELRGDDGAPLVIPHAEIERLRVGKGESETGAYFETRLWRRGEPAPLILRAPRDQWYPYAAAIRSLATHIAASHGVGAIERGLTRGIALTLPLAMLALTLAAGAISLFVLVEEPWWGRLIVPAIPALLLAVCVWLATARQWPRSVASLAELDRFLPPSVHRG